MNVFLTCNFLIYFLLIISELSKSDGEDGYDLSIQFDKTGPNLTTDTNGEPVIRS